jgi:hypothetical protein
MKNTMNNIRNKFVALLVMLLFAIGPVQAQVFIMDEDVEGNIRVGGSKFEVPVPYQGGDWDQYLPLGDGIMLLTALGGAYLLKKRKDEKAK